MLPPHTNEKLSDIIKKVGSKKLISIELNPYKPIDYNLVAKINPSFCSLTWIASPKDPKDPKDLKPLILSKYLVSKGYTVLVHVPCLFYTKREMKNILEILKDYGVRNILAMRGGGPWLKIENCDFPFAQMFIEFIRDEFNYYFDIVVAGFPNVHPATGSMDLEMFILRQKLQAGASIILTQACMCPGRYIDYRELCTRYTIDIPIIYGVLILKSWNDFVRIKRMSLIKDRHVMKSALLAKRQKKGREHARKWTIHIMRQLLSNDITVGVHIFTQNCFELAKNLIIESNAHSVKLDLRKLHKRLRIS